MMNFNSKANKMSLSNQFLNELNLNDEKASRRSNYSNQKLRSKSTANLDYENNFILREKTYRQGELGDHVYGLTDNEIDNLFNLSHDSRDYKYTQVQKDKARTSREVSINFVRFKTFFRSGLNQEVKNKKNFCNYINLIRSYIDFHLKSMKFFDF
jgi:hypothetical protein